MHVDAPPTTPERGLVLFEKGKPSPRGSGAKRPRLLGGG
jgi:hypothetical protein